MGNGILEKSKWAIILVTRLSSSRCRGCGIWNVCKAFPKAGRAGIVDRVVTSAISVEEGASDVPIRVVIPGGGIRRRAAKKAQGGAVPSPSGKITAVQSFEARGPGEIEASRADEPARIGIFVSEVEMIGAIEQVL